MQITVQVVPGPNARIMQASRKQQRTVFFRGLLITGKRTPRDITREWAHSWIEETAQDSHLAAEILSKVQEELEIEEKQQIKEDRQVQSAGGRGQHGQNGHIQWDQSQQGQQGQHVITRPQHRLSSLPW